MAGMKSVCEGGEGYKAGKVGRHLTLEAALKTYFR